MNPTFPSIRITLIVPILLGLSSHSTFAADWPMWRYDANRSAASPEELPATLHLRWERHNPPLAPAWPDQDRMQFDAGYEPIVADGRLFFSSSFNNSVTALDARTGNQLWRFYADGPVRFAPAAWNGNLYFCCDDGFVYSIRAEDGKLNWRFFAGLDATKILGNQRMISAWPSRGGIVLSDGIVYATAGIWPFMGISLYALDAQSGQVLWSNEKSGSIYINQPHNSPAFAGVAPQGYLVVQGDKLIVPSGRSVAAGFDRKTGEFAYYHIAENGKNGSSHTCAIDDYFINSSRLFDLATGKPVTEIENEPVLTNGIAYVTERDRIAAYNIAHPSQETYIDRRGNQQTRAKLTEYWSYPEPLKVHIKAGSRLYTGAPGRIVILTIHENNTQVEAAEITVEGTPWTMLAADGCLYVVMQDGRIQCYGEASGTKQTYKLEFTTAKRVEAWQSQAASILKQTGATGGYALALGIGSGELIKELVRQSQLHVVVLDSDKKRVLSYREELDADGLYGNRVAVLEGDILTAQLPPYFAALIVSEDIRAAGLDRSPERIAKAYDCLRPYGGVACLAVRQSTRNRFSQRIEEAQLTNAEQGAIDSFLTITRAGALPGAGSWTHLYADSANTCVSTDRLVKAPLGLLWFGGSSNSNILPRHGHGPSPLVLDGRLFIEGPDILRAMDVYTGRVLWEKELPGIGLPYDNTAHQPGANAIGSNYTLASDGVYVAYNDTVLRLDPHTGETLSEFRLPVTTDSPEHPPIGYIGTWDRYLVLGSTPVWFETEIHFAPDELKETDEAILSRWSERIQQSGGDRMTPRSSDESKVDYLVRGLNQLLIERNLPDILPPPGTNGPWNEIRSELQTCLAKPVTNRTKTELMVLNRRWLQAFGDGLPEKRLLPGSNLFWSGTSSQELVVLDRTSGEVIWTYKADQSIRHNTICIGGGMLFCIDRTPETILQAMARRGQEPQTKAKLSAFDIQSGNQVWSTDENIFGTWLSFSEPYGVLLQAGRSSRDNLPEPNKQMIAYKAKTGEILWSKDFEEPYGGPCLLHGSTIITQGFALNLLTGERKMRRHPLTGESIPWSFSRNYGCNSAIGSEHLLTFRSAAAGFYDLLTDGGTGNFGGFRSSCTANLIVADGILNAPDYTRTCVCSYQNQSSLALIHRPEIEMWTFNRLEKSEAPVRTVGVNFGAPGDRVADNGTLWLEYPSSGSPSPEITIQTEPENPTWFRELSARFVGQGPSWVTSSGAQGLQSVTIALDPHAEKPRPYTVRLYFAEPESLSAGARVFDVSMQGQVCIQGLDIVRESGGAERGLVKEFKGIHVQNNLIVALKSNGNPSNNAPIISGIEVLAESD